MSSSAEDGRTVFVTVGTTSFDELIRAVTGSDFLQLLKAQGYDSITLQIGRGQFTPNDVSSTSDIRVNWYRYKDSLATDMKGAELIISHGGAGSITESLSFHKPLIVAINEQLMDNHQTELAKQLHKDGHLLYTTCRDLCKTLEELPSRKLVNFEPGRAEKFGEVLDQIMGFSSKQS